jgi:hypothetical protein
MFLLIACLATLAIAAIASPCSNLILTQMEYQAFTATRGHVPDTILPI